MRSFLRFGLLAAAVLASVASSARAQVYGNYGPPPTVAPPAVTIAPVLPAPVMLPVRPLTVSEFAASFRPLPGHYEVLLIHPKTCCPVKVCFTLKPGCIRTVRVNAHKIDFVYSRQCDVVIRFLHSGRVWVRD